MHQWNDLQNRDLGILPTHFAEDPGEIPRGSGKGFLGAWPAEEPVQDFHADSCREPAYGYGVG